MKTTANCAVCGTEFSSYNTARRFCSKQCWYSYSRGSSRGPYSKSRTARMVAAKSRALQVRQLPIVEQVLAILELGYITNKQEICRRLPLTNSDTILRCLASHSELSEKLKSLPKYPLKIQKLSAVEFVRLKDLMKDGQARQDVYAAVKSFDLSTSTIDRFRKALGLKYAYYIPALHMSNTLPERIFAEMLDELGLSYEEQVKVANDSGSAHKYFVIDFVVEKDTAVEIQGDYWHGNPALYEEHELNDIQLSNRLRDVIKLQVMRKNYASVFVFWERELKSNKKRVAKLLEETFCKCKQHQ